MRPPAVDIMYRLLERPDIFQSGGLLALPTGLEKDTEIRIYLAPGVRYIGHLDTYDMIDLTIEEE